MDIAALNDGIEAVANDEGMTDEQKISELRDLRTRVEGALEFFEDIETPEVKGRRDLLKDARLSLDDVLDQLGDDVTEDLPVPKWRREDVVVTHAPPGSLERVRAERGE